ncbi:glycosyltransferase family 2 protein [Brytella acorum]|uniref:glycosyltransferase family 2 protein n=1 Tax=Brytella acorum TaxID=2959299 RepID=UPI0025AE5E6D|nr:glycosyltransferase family 2 protein [Brytella acorum]MDF3626220.1 glycosyltransferase family 2 protein [Brytella acorum]
MKTAVITMVYNEKFFINFWCSYYGMQFGFENLFILDNGSTDGSTYNIPGNVIRIPRGEFDDEKRANMISDFQSSLLYEFDSVIYTDCDEILTANNLMYSSLKEYIFHNPEGIIRAVGVDLMQDIKSEGEMDFSIPIFRQRRYGYITSWESKPLITRISTRWSAGFHDCNAPSILDKNVWLIHLKKSDFNNCLNRLEITRNISWSKNSIENNSGAHQRISNDDFIHNYENILSNRISCDLDVCDIVDILESNSSGPVGLIPERFRNF